MHFEERDIPSYAEPVSSTELRDGAVYFFVEYFDDHLLVPNMEPVVFIGRNLEPGDSGKVYFQDIGSYRKGVRYGEPNEGDWASAKTGRSAPQGDPTHLCVPAGASVHPAEKGSFGFAPHGRDRVASLEGVWQRLPIDSRSLA